MNLCASSNVAIGVAMPLLFLSTPSAGTNVQLNPQAKQKQ
jgi:hypothetical protein